MTLYGGISNLCVFKFSGIHQKMEKKHMLFYQPEKKVVPSSLYDHLPALDVASYCTKSLSQWLSFSIPKLNLVTRLSFVYCT